MKVLICGGGTGGHIYPALAVADELLDMGVPKENMLWIGTKGEIEETLVPEAGIDLKTIAAGAIVGVPLPLRIVNALKMVGGFFVSLKQMIAFKPDVSLMTGGYVNAPVALAARLARIPVVIYLPDIEPGMAIRKLSVLATKVACTAQASLSFFKPEKGVVTGYPVRHEFREARLMDKADALAQFDLKPERKTLLVFGGSRGARSINRALVSALPELLQTIQIIHISGTLDWSEINAAAAELDPTIQPNYRPYPYLHQRMGAAFRAADLALARAGASMLGEGPAFGLPAILVPYPYAWRYQRINADYLAERGAAIRINDEDLQENLLLTVMQLIEDESKLEEMSMASMQLDVPDSTTRIAGILISAGSGNTA